jgi:hypothetical protein
VGIRGKIMDKRIAGLLGAAAALTAVNNAEAATPAATLEPIGSYRDLLEPIPNALALLKTEDSQGGSVRANGDTRLAQHHHHHHHRYYRHHHHHRYYRHHYHHHHHWD